MRQIFSLLGSFALGVALTWYYMGLHKTSDTPLASAPFPTAINPADNGIREENVTKLEFLINNSPLSYEDNMLQQLEQGKYEAVLHDYSLSQKKVDDVEITRLRLLIFNHVRKLLKEGRTDKAHLLLNGYLDIDYNNVEGLELLSGINHREGKHVAEVEILYKARSYAHTSTELARLTESIRSAVTHTKQGLLESQDQLAILELYQRLTELEPEYAPYYIDLAQSYLALGNKNDARNAIELTLHDPSVVRQVNEIMLAIDKLPIINAENMVDIPLLSHGHQYLVQAVFNNQQTAVLLLDTGASLSIISTQLLGDLNLSFQATRRTAWFNTANGRVEAPIVLINTLSLGNQSVGNIEVGVMDIPETNIAGLLGMNYLRYFEFYIDQTNSVLRLSKRL